MLMKLTAGLALGLNFLSIQKWLNDFISLKQLKKRNFMHFKRPNVNPVML